MDIINRIKSVLFEPSKFFKNLKKEKGVKTAFLYLFVLSLFSTVMSIILTLIIRAFYNLSSNVLMSLFFRSIPGIVLLIVFTIIGFFLALLFSFVGAAILHVWILIFGGREDYTKTYQLYVYARTPTLLIGWIPIIGSLIGMIYSLILVIIGTQKVHNLSRRKSILMYVIPFLIVLLIIIFFILGIIFIMQNPNLLQNLQRY